LVNVYFRLHSSKNFYFPICCRRYIPKCNTPFEFCGDLFSFLRYALLKFHFFMSSFRYILFMCLHFLFTFAHHGFILYFTCVFIFFCLCLLVVASRSLNYRIIVQFCYKFWNPEYMYLQTLLCLAKYMRRYRVFRSPYGGAPLSKNITQPMSEMWNIPGFA